MKSSAVVVVGLGYVGLPLALLAAEKGHTVRGIDTNAEKVAAVKKSYPQIKASRLYSAVATADIIIICVPTPVTHDCQPDLRPLETACRHVGELLHKGQLVIIESTVNPGVCEEIVMPLLERISGLACGKGFSLAHCPERINPGDKVWSVRNIPRVVGGFDRKSAARAVVFYRGILAAPVRFMDSLKEAEAVKVVENSFRDINIAFVNELAMSFTKLGIDIVHVLDGAGTKPFSFMKHYPGMGVGGHCIPVDPYYLITYAEKNGFNHRFLRAAREVNNGMPQFAAKQLTDVVRSMGQRLSEVRVAILGLTYKPDVGDLRESPALSLLRLLRHRGVSVEAYDPYVLDEAGHPRPQHSTTALGHVLRNADVVMLATAHEAFGAITGGQLRRYGVRAVVDGRNFWDKEDMLAHDIAYRGIGR